MLTPGAQLVDERYEQAGPGIGATAEHGVRRSTRATAARSGCVRRARGSATKAIDRYAVSIRTG